MLFFDAREGPYWKQVPAQGDACLACAGEEGSERRGFWGRLSASAKLLWYEICVLHRHPVFLANIWAYVPVQAVLGALTFWGPKARARLVQICLHTCQPALWHSGVALWSMDHVSLHVCLCEALLSGLQSWSAFLMQQGVMRRRLRWLCCGSRGTRWTW